MIFPEAVAAVNVKCAARVGLRQFDEAFDVEFAIQRRPAKDATISIDVQYYEK
jgi:hypothetical protein